jgi:hypothetical protein
MVDRAVGGGERRAGRRVYCRVRLFGTSHSVHPPHHARSKLAHCPRPPPPLLLLFIHGCTRYIDSILQVDDESDEDKIEGLSEFLQEATESELGELLPEVLAKWAEVKGQADVDAVAAAAARTKEAEEEALAAAAARLAVAEEQSRAAAAAEKPAETAEQKAARKAVLIQYGEDPDTDGEADADDDEGAGAAPKKALSKKADKAARKVSLAKHRTHTVLLERYAHHHCVQWRYAWYMAAIWDELLSTYMSAHSQPNSLTPPPPLLPPNPMPLPGHVSTRHGHDGQHQPECRQTVRCTLPLHPWHPPPKQQIRVRPLKP